MGLEAPQTQTPEQPNPTAQEIAAAFTDARQEIYKLTADPSFHESCLDQGVDPLGDMDKPDYWYLLAQHVGEQVEAERSQDGNSLRLSTLELLSQTPLYLFQEKALTDNDHASYKDRQWAREIVSYFNSSIRVFAQEFPEARAQDVHLAMLGMANMALEDKSMRQSADQALRQTIRGAQHELAFGQILHQAGRQFVPASLEEDLKGIDYIVQDSRGRAIAVDVKASLSEVEGNGSTSAFAVKPNGTAIMYSLTQDSEFHNKFFIDDTAVALKVPFVDQYLTAIEHRLAA